MSISLQPGYDFSLTEQVTKTKLLAWIGGVNNSGVTITDADLGLSFSTISVAATIATSVTEGSLALDTSNGMLCINTRYGYVPFACTRGGLFTKRVKNAALVALPNRNWFGAAASNFFRETSAPAFALSSYSAGVHLVGFGVDVENLRISQFHTSAMFCGGTLWPSLEHPWVGGFTVGSCATNHRDLNSFGGWRPYLSTCATNGYTAPTVTSAVGGLITNGAKVYVTAADFFVKLGLDTRNGQRAGIGSMCQFGYGYPVWEYDSTDMTQQRFF